MSHNEDFDFDNGEFSALLEKCEQTFATGNEVYFDVDEFIRLIDYYIEQDSAKDKMQKLFAYAEKQHGFNSDIASLKAVSLIDYDRADEALLIYHKLFTLEPDNALHAADLSFTYAHLGDISNMLFYLKRAIALNPEEEENAVCYICSELLLHAHNDAALKILEETRCKFPENTEILFLLGRCCNALENHKKSIEVFQALLRLKPYSCDSWFSLGAAYMFSDQFDEAIEALDYALAIDADFIEAYFVKAACLADSDNMQAAIETFEEVIQRKPNHIEALESLVDCYFELNDLEQAENYLRRMIDIEPDFARVWAKLAHINAHNGNHKQAITLFQKALELEPDNCTIIMDFATLLSALNINDAAIALSKQALKLEKCDDEIWLKYSEILRNNNEPNKAIEILQRAITYIQTAPLYYTLAELFVEQKKFDKALEYFAIAHAEDSSMTECFFENCTLPSDKLELFHSILHK